jgi:hypothetical protein
MRAGTEQNAARRLYRHIGRRPPDRQKGAQAMKRLVIAAGLLLATPVAADTAQDVQAIINADGHACPQVTSLAGAGKVDNGDWLLRAVCSDGESWILQINAANQVVHVVKCRQLQAMGSNIAC